MTGEQPDARAELSRLRKLEQNLRAERERIRAAAAGEIQQLQTALRETASRAAQRERELQSLRAALGRGSGGWRLRRRGAQLDPFERERQQLEERARAVAATESRQRKTQAELAAERERLELAGEGKDGELLAELREGERRIEELEQELLVLRAEREDRRELLEREEIHAREVELAQREEELARREVELSLLKRRIGEEERRLQERAWRSGALRRHEPGDVVARPAGELTFSEGWRLLSSGHDGEARPEQADWRGGNW